MKRGLILNNIGTPNSPEAKDVKVYLDEFLMDPDVIGLPFFFRWLLVKGLITPFRSKQSGSKYKLIWTNDGSPLMVNTKTFAEKLARELGPEWVVRIGMRYGEPSLRSSLEELRREGVTEVILAPLFPQFAQATTGSAEKAMRAELKEMNWDVPARTLAAFHATEEFLRPQAELLRPSVEAADHVLFSFHGLPESAVRKTPGCEINSECCSRPESLAKGCYRAQSLATARDLARLLELPAGKWSAAFQSRLGPSKWIGPATDETLRELAAKGVKHLVVACPSFVADCLETLEEIGIAGQETFHAAGGKTYRLIPCLNDDDRWVRGFSAILRNRHPTSPNQSQTNHTTLRA